MLRRTYLARRIAKKVMIYSSLMQPKAHCTCSSRDRIIVREFYFKQMLRQEEYSPVSQFFSCTCIVYSVHTCIYMCSTLIEEINYLKQRWLNDYSRIVNGFFTKISSSHVLSPRINKLQLPAKILSVPRIQLALLKYKPNQLGKV